MKILTTAATIAAVLASAGAVMAAPPTTATTPPAMHRGQIASNESLRVARRHVERAIDELQRDASDYGGHKEKAVDDLGVARQYIEQGLQFRENRRDRSGTPSGNSGVPHQVIPTSGGLPPSTTGAAGNGEMTGNGEINERNEIRNQGGSNENITDVRRHVEAAIDALNSDASDYGGFKERAIDKLQQARQELEAAQDFIHNPGVRNGGTGKGVSDANLRFVNEHIQAAIDQLNSDRKDYGGHRAAAVSDLERASSDIASALSFDQTHQGAMARPGANGAMAPGGAMVNRPVTMPATISQGASNSSIEAARQHVETAIDALKRDSHDYGGFRVKAIEDLTAARSQLLAALNFR